MYLSILYLYNWDLYLLIIFSILFMYFVRLYTYGLLFMNSTFIILLPVVYLFQSTFLTLFMCNVLGLFIDNFDNNAFPSLLFCFIFDILC